MSERGISFSGPMLPPILSGQKTMTRRTIKTRTDAELRNDHSNYRYDGLGMNEGDEDCHYLEILDPQGERTGRYRSIGAAPWKVNDLLWVRETWAAAGNGYTYRADMPAGMDTRGMGWKSPRFMPKAAARIWLCVSDVRAEQLQAISPEDALSEGIKKWVIDLDMGLGLDDEGETFYQVYTNKKNKQPADWTPSPVISFQSLWQAIHGPDSWSLNPWIWIVEFERITQPVV